MTTALALGVLIVAGVLSISMTTPGLRRLALTNFSVHILMAFSIFYVAGLVAPDATIYHSQAVHFTHQAAGDWVTGPRVTVGKAGWPILLSILYGTATPSPLLGLVVNAWFCAMTVPLLAAIARGIGATSKAAKRVAWLSFLPPFLLWGSLLLREAGMWFFLLIMCLGALRIAGRTQDPFGVLLLSTGLFGAASFRASAALIAGAALLGALLILSRSAPTVKFLISVSGLAMLPFGLRFARNAELTDTASLARSQEALSQAESGFSSGSLTSFPLNMARTLAGPFPWELPSLGALYLVEWICWVPIAYLVLRNFRRNFRRGAVLFAPAAGLAIALAYTSGNYGTMVRLRDSALIILVPLITPTGQFRRGETDSSSIETELPAK